AWAFFPIHLTWKVEFLSLFVCPSFFVANLVLLCIYSYTQLESGTKVLKIVLINEDIKPQNSAYRRC
ncbi:hypothetical protein, partial [Runella sp.]|uniref:hypothetical protein n=1 Tax=Runella sp. TaxID=1960881 RepID=UPI0026086EA1